MSQNGNRLKSEKSPYLLQHADNPVDWYPWGQEAFDKAAAEDKPVFLSIGYSTCHWCHVMEKESFEDEGVASLLNSDFVAVKVDREERPDIDGVYMDIVQAVTGRGGWPLTVLMTPEKKPFYAGTYFPKESRFGQPGLVELLPAMADVWKRDRDSLNKEAESVVDAVRQKPPAEGGELGIGSLRLAYQQLAERFDSVYAGFGSAPKFPMPHNLSFLLRYADRGESGQALEMAEATLRAMRRGGVYDQLGHGFHRYSTDRLWLLPHFEKMLYDQALGSIAYVEAYQVTGKEEYANTAREILDYVLRDMTSPEGGFYSAEDADSEGVEGKFYMWTTGQLREALDEDDAFLAERVYRVLPSGNFQDEASGEASGRNVAYMEKDPDDVAEELGVPKAEMRRRLQSIREALFAARRRRVPPLKDDKVLCDWNGLMIAALSKAALATRDVRYADAATKAVRFVLSEMRDDSGRLLHRFRDGEAAIPAYVDDYAFLVWGLIELYEATFEPEFLEQAREINEQMLSLLWDERGGGLFFSSPENTDVLFRSKESVDGALPSGNSVAALNLLRLGRLLSDAGLEKRASELLSSFARALTRFPAAHTQMLIALDFALGPTHEVVIAGRREEADTQAMLDKLGRSFLPRTAVLLRAEGAAIAGIEKLAPFSRGLDSIDGKATAYVCTNHACNAPTTDAEEMMRQVLLDRQNE